jgi:hypothetical protein
MIGLRESLTPRSRVYIFKVCAVCYLNLHTDCVLRWELQTLGIKNVKGKVESPVSFVSIAVLYSSFPVFFFKLQE